MSSCCSLRESLLRDSPSLQWSCSPLGVLISFSFHATNIKTEESYLHNTKISSNKGQTQTTAFLGATNLIATFCWVLVFISKKQISTWKVRLKTIRLNRGKDPAKDNLHFSESEYEHVISKCCLAGPWITDAKMWHLCSFPVSSDNILSYNSISFQC